jgi:hypothetical protein
MDAASPSSTWIMTTARRFSSALASHTLKPSVAGPRADPARSDLPTKLRAFELGVDDIVTTPFSPEELLARAVVIVRRASGIDRPIVPTITIGEVEIDILHREVRTGTSVIHLSGIEQNLLYVRQPRRPGRDPRGDPRRCLGHRFHRRATSSIATSGAFDQLPGTTDIRASSPRSRSRLSVHPDVLEPGDGPPARWREATARGH